MKKEQRLCKNCDFQALYHNGLRLRSLGFVLYCRKSLLPESRMGIVISRRMGCAVTRNKLRRRIRSLFDFCKKAFEVPHDFVFIVTHPTFATLPFSCLRDRIELCLRRIPATEK